MVHVSKLPDHLPKGMEACPCQTGCTIGPPKTKDGKRTVALLPHVYGDVLDHLDNRTRKFGNSSSVQSRLDWRPAAPLPAAVLVALEPGAELSKRLDDRTCPCILRHSPGPGTRRRAPRSRTRWRSSATRLRAWRWATSTRRDAAPNSRCAWLKPPPRSLYSSVRGSRPQAPRLWANGPASRSQPVPTTEQTNRKADTER